MKKTAQEEEIDMNMLLQSLLNNVRIQYAEIEIKEEISDELYPVRGVKPYLSNAIYNVILNGIESVRYESPCQENKNQRDKKHVMKLDISKQEPPRHFVLERIEEL